MDEFDDINNLYDIFALLGGNDIDDLIQMQDTVNLLKDIG